MKNFAVLMVGLGQPATFIQRKILAIANSGITVYVEVKNKHDFPVKHPNIYLFQSNTNHRLKNLLQLFFGLLKKPKYFIQYIQYFHNTENQGWFSSLYLAGSMNQILKFPANIVHVQWTYLARRYQIAAQYMNAKLIASVRGSQVTISPYLIPERKSILLQNIELVDYFHCVSNSMKDAIVSYGADPNLCFVNYNGILLEKFTPLALPIKPEQPINIISIGLLIWRKNFSAGLYIADKLRSMGISFSWNIVGEGTDFGQLKYLIKTMNLENHVFLVGKKKEADLIPLLQKSDVLLSTSVGEGLANVIVEAMACGVIPVVWECEGMQEAIVSGKSGYIFPVGNIDETASTIAHLVSNPELMSSIKKASRMRAESFFDEKVHTQKMIDWYRSLMN